MAALAVTGPDENRRFGEHGFTSARFKRLGGNLEPAKRSISLAAEERRVEGGHAVDLRRKRRCGGGLRLGPMAGIGKAEYSAASVPVLPSVPDDGPTAHAGGADIPG